jgi:anti-sigma factor RsiW
MNRIEEQDALIHLALRQLKESEPPANFSAEVILHIEKRTSAFELKLARLLGVVFAVALFACLLEFGMPLWQLTQQMLGETVFAWSLIAIGCLGLSLGIERLSSRMAHLSS